MLNSCTCIDNTDIKASIKFYCKTCSREAKKFNKKKFKAAVLLALGAYGGSQLIDYAITDNRYPIETEFAILEACISSVQKPLSGRSYIKKQKVCLCALEESMNEISYIRFSVDEQGFLTAFNKHAKECR